MPLDPHSLRRDDRPGHAADAPRDGFREWSRHVGDRALGPARPSAPRPDLLGLDLGHPLLKLAAVAFVGYTLGTLLHRGSASTVSAAAPPSRPAPAARPRPLEREPRSSIRFR